MVNNLENIPACLRVIARQIESGEILANVGVLTLRQAGPFNEPVVFGFGKELDPFLELELASDHLRTLESQSDEQEASDAACS